MNRKLFVVFVLFGVAFTFLYGGDKASEGKIVKLAEITRPRKIQVSGEELFVVDNRFTIMIYSLKDFKLKKQFGKKGEGPGEFKRPVSVSVLDDSILVDSQDKLSWFTKEGKFLKHKNKSTRLTILPFKNKYIGYNTRFLSRQKIKRDYGVFDSEFKNIKTRYEYTIERSLLGPNIVVKEWKLLNDYSDIYSDIKSGKIFVSDSKKGFFIKVFDENCEELYTINKDKEIKKIKISDAYKNEKINEFKQGGFWKFELKQHKTKLTFPEYFPPFGWMAINNGKIYAHTYKMKNNKSLFIVLDLKGKILKEVYLPVQHEQGHRRQTVHNNKFYKLIEDLENESWKLLVLDI